MKITLKWKTKNPELIIKNEKCIKDTTIKRKDWLEEMKQWNENNLER